MSRGYSPGNRKLTKITPALFVHRELGSISDKIGASSLNEMQRLFQGYAADHQILNSNFSAFKPRIIIDF
jgi:hypothetical protein